MEESELLQEENRTAIYNACRRECGKEKYLSTGKFGLLYCKFYLSTGKFGLLYCNFYLNGVVLIIALSEYSRADLNTE